MNLEKPLGDQHFKAVNRARSITIGEDRIDERHIA
jgi:hypothetical protein